MASEDIKILISVIAKLPGLGPRSAARVALALIKQKETLMIPLSKAINSALILIKTCNICGNLDTLNPCNLCCDERRDKSVICVVEDVADLWALERSSVFKGAYHVLGGTLSALDGVGPDDLNIPKLGQRATEPYVTEVILATNATVDGQITAHYIAERLRSSGVSISGLAHGIPIGGELDYLDDGTLSAALKSRHII
jgi:recombination protein RecR